MKEVREFWIALCLAVAAALAVKVPSLFGLSLADDPGFHARNASLLVLPLLGVYFVWKRSLRSIGVRTIGVLLSTFALGAVFTNAYPFEEGGATELLAALHLPIILWLLVGVAYVGGEWRSHDARMDFVRFSGEWLVYMGLFALGGGVLAGLTQGTFEILDVDATGFIQNWLLPCGAAGAAVIAAWLVDSRRAIIENVAPVLARAFIPLFTLLLMALLGTIVWTRTEMSLDRDALAVVTALLVLVLALMVYAIAARQGTERVLLIDRVQFALGITAWGLAGVVVATMLARLAEYGMSPNRTAALGIALIVFVNLTWTSWVGHVMLHNNCSFSRLDRFQTRYLPVYAMWATAVVVVFPPVFGFA
ncbi:MAG: hypothetical protein JW722_02610 [Demequinaceae bacterium]|nr:hypothetical protein [Demequinaceae bacterium]